MLLWPELAKSSFFLYEKSDFSLWIIGIWKKNMHWKDAQKKRQTDPERWQDRDRETERKKKEKKNLFSLLCKGPWLNLALCTEDVAFTLIYCFSTLKNSITFLQGLNLLLGKGCSISLQLPLQLKSHLGLIWIFSVGTNGVGILSPSFLLLAAIWNKKNGQYEKFGITWGLQKWSDIAINSRSSIFRQSYQNTPKITVPF